MSGLIPRAPRRKVMIPARMRAGGGQADLCIRDMSARAMLIETASPPAPGTYVEILSAQQAIAGRVIWARSGHCGVGTRERLNPAAGKDGVLVAPTAAAAHNGRAAAGSPPTADLRHRADRSRFAGRLLEHMSIVICAALAAVLIAVLAYATVSHAFAKVSASLPAGV